MAVVGLAQTLAQRLQMEPLALPEQAMAAVEILTRTKAEEVMVEHRAVEAEGDVIRIVTEEMVREAKSASGCGEDD